MVDMPQLRKREPSDAYLIAKNVAWRVESLFGDDMKSGDEMPRARLGEFILQNLETILQAWEDFARSIWPGEPAEVEVLRDSAASMLKAVVHDISTIQTKAEQQAKSEGRDDGDSDEPLNESALSHALSRVESGFDIVKLVAEFRALRASVNRIWSVSSPEPDPRQIEDMLRFNEAIDQLVAASVAGFSERVERSRRLFLGILGHDLRQPLQSMRMLVEMLGNAECLPMETGPVREKMKLVVAAMAGLLSDLLDFSSSQLGEAMPVHRAPANLEAICQEIVSELRCAYPLKDFQVATEGNLDGEWDAARLRQMISNLLYNAVQHGTGRSIHLSVRGLAEITVIEVHNSGAPIPAEAIGTLFDPMVRLSRRETERPQGSIGLGLYICREIALAHGGSIDVKSSAGLGTTFTVELPKHSLAESHTAAQMESLRPES